MRLWILPILILFILGCSQAHLTSEGKITIPFSGTQSKKDLAKFMGIVYKGESKEDILNSVGYPKEIYKKDGYVVWYYEKLYNVTATDEPFRDIEIYFKNGYVIDCKQINNTEHTI